MSLEISVAELRAQLAQGDVVLVLDVRSPQEFADGHAEGAVNLPLPMLESDPGALPPGRPVVTVCGKGGGRSLAAAELLDARGVGRVAFLAGGTTGWAAAGGPISRG